MADHEEIQTIEFEDGHSVNITTAALKEQFGVATVAEIDPSQLKEFHKRIDAVRAMHEPNPEPTRAKE